MKPLHVQLQVNGGPEAGKSANFAAPVITIGRGPHNDLVLHDGLVSQSHGELVRQPMGMLYRDLKSRHGTLVRLDRVTVNLHNRQKPQEISLIDGAQLTLGESLISIHVDDRVDSFVTFSDRSGDQNADISTTETLKEQVVTRSQDSLEKFARRLSTEDPRLASIFMLSRKLNRASDLDEILDLLVAATFEAFGAANFCAITLLSETVDGPVIESQPLIARQRGDVQDGSPSAPIIFKSLLTQVADTRESVLFVRDDSGTEPSHSIVAARITACLAAPLISEHELIGVMQADTRGEGALFGADDLDLFTVVASYAAFAIERVRLNNSIVAMFEGFVRASVSAVDARDPSTAGHSARVADYTLQLAQAVCACSEGPLADITFSDLELRELRYAALLHDFGKIGVKEAVLTKAERLYPKDKRVVDERFETIRAQRAYEIQRRALSELQEGARTAHPGLLAEIDREIEESEQTIDEMCGFLRQHQRAYSNTPEAIERLGEIARSTFSDLRGAERPYLTPREQEHLSVPVGTLTRSEWDHMRAHTKLSRAYLAQIPWSDTLGLIPIIAGAHHEKLDGSGYPDGISGDEIPIQVRMLTICDVFDAMTAADRPYRAALSIDHALGVLEADGRSGALDEELVRLFKVAVVEPLVERRERTGNG